MNFESLVLIDDIFLKDSLDFGLNMKSAGSLCSLGLTVKQGVCALHLYGEHQSKISITSIHS